MRSLMRRMVVAMSSAAAFAAAHAQAGGAVLPSLADVPGGLQALTSLIVALAGVAMVWLAFWDAPEEGFAVRWQAGGFGGPSRGWRVSKPLARLIAGLTMVVLGVALGLAQLSAKEQADAKADAAKPPAATASAAASAASK